ncbi:MAG TPA: FAD-dependent oxidoreductase [Rhodothermales bacterium]|nr:FAD-dependent oxidoreductase [Rhodothermales bacterium]
MTDFRAADQSIADSLKIKMPSGSKLRVAVLGAGVCGLYAARVLARAGADVTVIEREEEVGGLARGYLINGNYYDVGVHHLHAWDHDIFQDIQAIMGDLLIPVELVAKIKHGNSFRRYPLEFADLLLGIPPWTLLGALSSLTLQQIRNKFDKSEPTNAEEALIKLYGRHLYEYFFRDFTQRYWGFPPTRLSATFVTRKMPRLSAVDIVKNWLKKLGVKETKDIAVDSALRKETLWYSRIGASMMPRTLAKYIESKGAQIILEAEVDRVNVEDGKVRSVTYLKDGETATVECDAVVSTIPVNALVRSVSPGAGDELLASCDHIKFKAIAIYGLLVKKERVLEDALYVYFREHVFHRFSEPKGSGVTISPEGHTTILVEVTCDIGDDRWKGGEETRRKIVKSLEKEGMLKEEDIVEMHLLTNEWGYPVFALGFEPHLERLEKYLAEISNLESTGRQGAFTYPNMHDAMRMGVTAARAIAQRSEVQEANEERVES